MVCARIIIGSRSGGATGRAAASQSKKPLRDSRVLSVLGGGEQAAFLHRNAYPAIQLLGRFGAILFHFPRGREWADFAVYRRFGDKMGLQRYL